VKGQGKKDEKEDCFENQPRRKKPYYLVNDPVGRVFLPQYWFVKFHISLLGAIESILAWRAGCCQAKKPNSPQPVVV
jgi:hypothetical protein